MEVVKRQLKEEILKPRYRDAFGPVVNAVLVEQGLAATLCNTLHAQEEELAKARSAAAPPRGTLEHPDSRRADASPLPAPPFGTASDTGELSVVLALRDKWAAQLHTTLMTHCEATGQPLMRVTSASGMTHAGGGTRGGSGGGGGPKYLYTLDDLAALLHAVVHPNHAGAGRVGAGARSWSLTPVEIATPGLAQLRAIYAELAPSERQSGLDDEMRGWFSEARYAVGARLLTNGYAPHLRQYARCGVPAGLRGRVWMGALRVGPVAERDFNYFAALQREVGRVTLATDSMVRDDAAAPAREEEYFVFSELTEELLLAFCRDSAVSQRPTSGPKPAPIVARNRSGQKALFPPSGVPPGHGLVDLLCPLCFVYAQVGSQHDRTLDCHASRAAASCAL